jgi:hypothetical protein
VQIAREKSFYCAMFRLGREPTHPDITNLLAFNLLAHMQFSCDGAMGMMQVYIPGITYWKIVDVKFVQMEKIDIVYRSVT